jgi:hypothetical protein
MNCMLNFQQFPEPTARDDIRRPALLDGQDHASIMIMYVLYGRSILLFRIGAHDQLTVRSSGGCVAQFEWIDSHGVQCRERSPELLGF